MAPMRPRMRAALLASFLTSLAVYMSIAAELALPSTVGDPLRNVIPRRLHQAVFAEAEESQRAKAALKSCQGWNPHGLPEDDPADCLRAKQLRQIQRFRATNTVHLDEHQKEAIDHLERCATGILSCPERPLIANDYWWAHIYKETTSGESVWAGPIIRALKSENYAWLSMNHEQLRESWRVVNALSESLNMYFTDEANAFVCTTDPRCVRPQDYFPSENATMRLDASLLDADELGVIPSYRVFGLSYWGTRPEHYNGQGKSARLFWDMAGDDGEGEWAMHPLGAAWQLVPWDYPKHTWIPISVEETCLTAPFVPPSDRSNQVMIIAKESEYYHYDHLPGLFAAWPEITAAMKNDNIELVTVAKEAEGKPIPQGLSRIGQQGPLAYNRMVASARAMLGIGRPEMSPSPYTSLCRGVPVVLPYWAAVPSDRNAVWAQYHSGFQQHGEAMRLGEPYVYAYNGSDTGDLVAQLRKAIATPIEPFVPDHMKAAAVAERTREVLGTDWEAEAEKVIRDNGGVHPRLPQRMLEACTETNTCPRPQWPRTEDEEKKRKEARDKAGR